MENELGLSSALFSLCGRYRYGLFRVKGSPFSEAKALGFIMLNPSTADGEKDDPTIKRCMSFADSFGYQGILVANLYSYRATDPTDLWVELDPVGPFNDDHLRQALRAAEKVVCAWGTNAEDSRVDDFLNIAEDEGIDLYCLGINQDGSPKHPLYLKGDSQLIPFKLFKETS